MNLDDAARVVGRLKAAYPMMTLDEAEAEVLVREVALLADPLVAADALDRLIRSEQRFPTIALIRAAYRSVAEGRRAVVPQIPAGTSEIPEWVHVWYWQTGRTRLARQIANTESKLPVVERRPVKMRDFPQMENPYPSDGGSATRAAPDAYSAAEYEAIRAEWVEAGSPRAGSAAEIVAGAAG